MLMVHFDLHMAVFGITFKFEIQLGADVMLLQSEQFERVGFLPCSEQLSSARSCTKFRIAPSWNVCFLPSAHSKRCINLCFVSFCKTHISNCFPVAFQKCRKGEKSLTKRCRDAPVCFFCFVAHEQLYDDLKSWVSGRLSFSAAGVCQWVWILNQMETSSLKTCNLLCAEMHICLVRSADLWLPLRLFEITKEDVLKALNIFCLGFFFFHVWNAELTVVEPTASRFSTKPELTAYRNAALLTPLNQRAPSLSVLTAPAMLSLLGTMERNTNINDFLYLLISWWILESQGHAQHLKDWSWREQSSRHCVRRLTKSWGTQVCQQQVKAARVCFLPGRIHIQLFGDKQFE